MAPLIEFTDITKTYGGVAGHPALDELSLQVSRGECSTIAGPLGNGKSTLLHLVAGLDHLSSGSFFLWVPVASTLLLKSKAGA